MRVGPLVNIVLVYIRRDLLPFLMILIVAFVAFAVGKFHNQRLDIFFESCESIALSIKVALPFMSHAYFWRHGKEPSVLDHQQTILSYFLAMFYFIAFFHMWKTIDDDGIQSFSTPIGSAMRLFIFTLGEFEVHIIWFSSSIPRPGISLNKTYLCSVSHKYPEW